MRHRGVGHGRGEVRPVRLHGGARRRWLQELAGRRARAACVAGVGTRHLGLFGDGLLGGHRRDVASAGDALQRARHGRLGALVDAGEG